MSQGGFGHHEQVIDIMDMLEVKRRNKIMNKTRGEDSESPASQATAELACPLPVDLAECPSWLSRLALEPAHGADPTRKS